MTSLNTEQWNNFVVDKLSQPNMAASSGLYGKMFCHTTLREKIFSIILLSYLVTYHLLNSKTSRNRTETFGRSTWPLQISQLGHQENFQTTAFEKREETSDKKNQPTHKYTTHRYHLLNSKTSRNRTETFGRSTWPLQISQLGHQENFQTTAFEKREETSDKKNQPTHKEEPHHHSLYTRNLWEYEKHWQKIWHSCLLQR